MTCGVGSSEGAGLSFLRRGGKGSAQLPVQTRDFRFLIPARELWTVPSYHRTTHTRGHTHTPSPIPTLQHMY